MVAIVNAAAEVQLTITYESVHRIGPLPGTEPCECCGQQLLLADVLAMARDLAGLTTGEARPPQWHEVHDDFPRRIVRMRPHTPDRCRRIRAGDPEPWSDLDDDLEDQH